MKIESISINKKLNIGLKAGHSDAFNQLFNLHYKQLYFYALKLTFNSDHAEDLVQEAISSLWTNRNNIIAEKPIVPYLYTSIKNSFITSYHKEKKKLDFIDEIKNQLISELQEDDEEDHKQLKLSLIDSEIEKLPKKSKTIFDMNKKEGLRVKEIGRILNLSEKTVESHLYRALKRIRTELTSS